MTDVTTTMIPQATVASDTREPISKLLLRRHLPSLDGLRAIAVFMVILGHLGVPLIAADLGVSVFFVLSGFLITWLLLQEEEAHGTISLKRFYARRSLRIFPAYYAYLIFSFALDTVLGDMRWKQIVLPALTYTVNYYNALHNHPSTSVAHAWSLAVEEQFYLFWPLLFLVLAPKGRRALLNFLVGSIVVVIAIRSVLYYGYDVGTAYVYNAFETRFDNLAVGCLLAVVATSGKANRLGELLTARLWFPLVTIILLLSSRFLLPNSVRYGPGLTIEALLVAALLVQLLILGAGRPWSFLQFPVLTWLGRLSYSLYLYHGWGNALGAKLVPNAGPITLLAEIACCVLLAVGSYYVVEQPFLRLKRRFSDTAPASVTA